MALRLQHAILKDKILKKSAAIKLEGVFPPLTTHNTTRKNKTESTHRAILREENEFTLTRLEHILLRITK
jgi:hypothetical protein